MDNRPIGVFDSGIGGLTVVNSLIDKMPNETIIYLGDTARLPYGNKSSRSIKLFSKRITQWLIEKDCKLIIVACNTASALALKFLCSEFNIPIIGMIRPGAILATETSKTNRIGVLGTLATISSKSYEKTLLDINNKITVFSKACPLFVPLAEEGWVKGEIPKSIARVYLKEIKDSKIDTLILGCTHYPIMKPIISEVLGRGIKLIDPGKASAKSVKKILTKENINADNDNCGIIKCYVTDSIKSFNSMAGTFLKIPINSIMHIELF